MVKGDDEIAALLADMEHVQYGTVTEPQAEKGEAPSVVSLARMQDADPKTLLRAEMSRHFAFQEIKAKFDLLCAELAVPPDRNVFIRWLLKMKYLERASTAEPLIPVAPRSKDGNLLDEFKKLGVDKGKINWFAQDLAKWTAKSHSKFVHVMEKASVKKIRVKLVEQTDGYVLQCGRTSVNVSKPQYKKLRAMYSATNANFNDRLFLTVMRYKVLQGKVMPALPERCKAVLREHLHVEMECYTTPLLTTTQRYCSLFADTDGSFGSLGNFIENRFEEGSFLVHPPLVHEIIDAAYDHMNRMLVSSSKPLSFAVIVPCWDARGVINIRNNEYTQMVIETEQRDNEDERFHQHSGPAPAQLVILQNEMGAATWPTSIKLREHFLQTYHNKRTRRNSEGSVDEAAETSNGVEAEEQLPQPTQNTGRANDKKKKRKLREFNHDVDHSVVSEQTSEQESTSADDVAEGDAVAHGDAQAPSLEEVQTPRKKSKKRKPLRKR